MVTHQAGRSPTSTDDAYFAEQWEHSDDPWSHGTRWYEARKYALTAAVLPLDRYHRGFEPGCGAGFLTTLIAPRVDRLLAMERERHGAEVARRRCANLPGVEVRIGRVPQDWPAGTFDLIVLSELLYYLDDADLDATLELAASSIAVGGHVVAVHYRREVAEHARPGDDVHDHLLATMPARLVHHVEDDFVLEVFAR